MFPITLMFMRASAIVHPSRLPPHRRPCAAVSFAVASDPQPISDHLLLSRRSVDCFEFLSLRGLFSGSGVFLQVYVSDNVHLSSQVGDDEMPRKASGKTYVWDPAKEKKFLEKLDEYLATTGGKQPTLAVLDIWAAQFNAEFGGVLAFGTTLSQKKVYKKCKHLRHEGLRNKELYYNVFEKNHDAGALGYGSVTMPDESQSYFDFDASMDNSAYRSVLKEDVTPTTGARHLNNSRSGMQVRRGLGEVPVRGSKETKRMR
ncbi:hypothetical protein TIFTF001_021058 [Ficus carica]|uniref:Uncharacterized protein n=1 Tax=Ficus carica TaxID=3494 RepID=A0AA88AGT5_FICCA|nr:hypothetical protein TIFTF001_021058 [Ficus carica]